MLPTFFIIGATKSGTTSFNHYLEAHPEIHMAPRKEPNFFVEPGDGLPTIADRVASLSAYESLFNSDLPARGEASTSYSHFPARRGVPERIKELVPDAKFIYLVRDPVDRIRSHYLHQVANNHERRPLKDAIGDLDRPENVYISASRYATQLERYLSIFPDDRILVIDHADLLSARSQVLRETFRFLAVDPTYSSPEFGRELNAAANNRQYPTIYVRLRDRGPLRRLPTAVRDPLKRAFHQTERILWPRIREPEIPTDVRMRLTALFEPEVSRLRALTGQPFSTWSL